MIERHSKVFVPVSTDERFPNKHGDFIVTQREGGYATTWEFDGEEEDFKKWVTHWLEEKENVYVHTEQELKEEKKKEAIAFADFLREEDILGKSYSIYTTEQLYSLYLNNQQK
jgi:hypothetical protein